jgi:hypothetical protein
MSSPVKLLGAGNQSVSASSSGSSRAGSRSRRSAARRGDAGRRPLSCVSALPESLPEMRMTATALRPGPLDSA